MNLRKNYLIPVLAFIGLVLALIVLTIAYFMLKQTKLSAAPRSLSWEECVKDKRSVIMESYPAKCSIAGIGSATQPLIDSSCQSDSDCTLVVNGSWSDCSLIPVCQPTDYSQDRWISVNQEAYSVKIRGCQIPAVMCDPAPLNDRFQSQCLSGTCRKVPTQ